eukprot:g3178.t1
MANRDDSGYKGLYRDDEVVVDKDGVPHYSGADPGLMKEYRRRVLFAYANLEGDGKDAQEEARDLAKKQQRFAKKLLDALHGEAWRCCQVLIEDIDKLREKDGYKHVFKCLQSIEKVTVIKKTEAFDTFFEKCHRRKGQSIDAFLRMQSQAWSDLQDITDGSTTMSEDLRTYFLLKHVGLSKDDRRQILLSNQSNYTMEGVEQALRVSYYDVHEREKSHSHRDWGNHQRGHQSYKKKHYAHAVTEEPNIPEEYENYETASEATVEDTFAVEDYEEEDPREVNSDAAASGDDEVFEAYAAMDRQRKSYKESRKHLRTLQKSRGFFHGDVKGEISIEDRKAAVQKEKQRTRCAACGKIGHWAGDQACAKTSSKIGPKKIDKKKGSGKGKSKGKAYLVGEAPSYFSLDFDEHDEDVTEFCNMVGEVKEELEEADPMLDADLEARRKKAVPVASESEWEAVSSVGASSTTPINDMTYAKSYPTATPIVSDSPTKVSVKVEIEIPASQIRTLLVPSFEDVRPGKLMEMKVYELSSECEAWGIATSGNKSELQNRLEAFFQGEPALESSLRNSIATFLLTYQSHKMELVINGQKDVKGDEKTWMDRPHIRFIGETGKEDTKWYNHKQNDALGYFLWARCQLALAGKMPFTGEHLKLCGSWAAYGALSAAAKDSSSTSFERLNVGMIWMRDTGRRAGGMSLAEPVEGAVLPQGQCSEHPFGKALHMLLKDIQDQKSFQTNVLRSNPGWLFPGKSDTLSVLETKLEAALKTILPNEVVKPPKNKKDADGALIFLCYPLEVVPTAMGEQILERLETITGHIAVCRYRKDSYWCKDYKEQRVLGFRWRLNCGGYLKKQQLYLARALAAITGDDCEFGAWMCAEAFYLAKGKWQPNDNTPLAAW